MRVLVVEDEAGLAEVIARRLRREGATPKGDLNDGNVVARDAPGTDARPAPPPAAG